MQFLPTQTIGVLPNSAVTSLLWLTLSIKDFDFTIWGEHCNTLHDFVHKISHQTGVLTQEPWIHQVLQCWGRFDPDNPGRISQQDAAEFIGTWLEVMKSPAFDLRWERRIEAEGATHLVDESASNSTHFSSICSHPYSFTTMRPF